ncbi:MAG: hypothetical protein KY476_06155 [Planctomycetes bacterium]|nr:hypothetical protein [Planctomycetota bacterium]
MDYTLIEWGRHARELEDEGVTAPDLGTVRRATQLARALKAGGFPAPDSVVIDPNGGIVFELRNDDAVEVFHVWDDGGVEYRRFRGTELEARTALSVSG